MHVSDRRYNLPKDRNGFGLSQTFGKLPSDKMVQVFAVTKLHYEVAFAWAVNNFKQPHDVGVF